MNVPSTSTTSPLHRLRLRELNSWHDAQFRRRAVDARLNGLSYAQRVPVRYNKPSATTCMNIDAVHQNFLLCGAANGQVTLLNLESPSGDSIPLPDKLSHEYMVTDCQWYADNIQLFITASMDNSVKLWDVSQVRHLEVFHTDRHPISLHWNEVDMSNPLIAVADMSTNISLIDLRVGSCNHELRWRDGGAASAVRWLPANQHVLITGDNRGKMAMWDVRSGRRPMWHRQAHMSAVGSLRCSKDATRLISADTHSIVIWDATRMRKMQTISVSDVDHSCTSANPSIKLCASWEGSKLRIALPDGDRIRVMTLDKPSNRHPCTSSEHVRARCLDGHFSSANAVVYRERTQQLLSSSTDRLVMSWSASKPLAEIQAEEGAGRGRGEAGGAKPSGAAATAIQDAWSDDEG